MVRLDKLCLQKRAAFTLVELLVVVALITVLIAILLPTLGKVRGHAARIACLSNLRQLGIALLSYANENRGVFPGAASVLQGQDEDWVHWQPNRDAKNSTLWAHLGGNLEVLKCPLGVPERLGGPAPPYPYSYSVNMRFTSLFTRGVIPAWAHPPCKLGRVVKPSRKILAAEEDATVISDGAWHRDSGPNSKMPYISLRHDGDGREYSDPNDYTLDPLDSHVVVAYRGRGNVVFADGHGDFIDRRMGLFEPYLAPEDDTPGPIELL